MTAKMLNQAPLLPTYPLSGSISSACPKHWVLVIVKIHAMFKHSLLELSCIDHTRPYIWYDLDKFLKYQSTNLLPTFASLTWIKSPTIA